MKTTSINSGRLSASKRIAPLAYSLTVILAVAGSLILLPVATTLSKAMRLALKAPAFGPAIPAQSQTATFYLHGTGPVANPPTLFLNTTTPTATTEKYKDSTSINRNGGNPWKEVGTWTAAPAMTAGTFASLSELHVWLGLKNSDDQGTYFDLRIEAYQNSTLVASGQSLCITGVTRNPTNAKEVVVGFDPFSAAAFNGTSDVLNLKVLTRVGTSAAGGSCGGHSNAVGLRLYFDAVSRPSRFNATQGTSDTTSPVLTVEQPAGNSITSATQINVTGTFSDQNQTTIVVSGVTASVQGNNFTATVPLTEGQNSLLIAATDAAGNRTEATRQIVRDTTPPVVVIQQPTPDAVTNSAQIDVTGTFSDATAITVRVNNVNATLAGNTFSTTLPLVEGVNGLNVVGIDAAGNQSEVSNTVTRDTAAPTLTVNTPADGLITSNHIVTVSVSASDATRITATANGTPLTLGPDGAFTEIISLPPGTNQVLFVATDAAGNQSQPLTRSVTVDDLPPVISELDPVEDTIVDGPTTAVHGRVTDITATAVKVNNIVAVVDSSGLFTAENVPVAEGDNRFTINAVDAAGNANSAGLFLTGKDRTPPQSPLIFPVSSPTRLAFQAIEGRAEPGSRVTITGGLQPVVVGAASGTGLFVVNLDLVAGFNTFTAAAADAEGNTSSNSNFSVTSDPGMQLPPAGQPAQINISTGDAQRGLGGMELPRPLIAIVTDRNGDPLPGIDVTFTMTHGDGHFLNGNHTEQVVTDAGGHASIRYVSGSGTGIHIIRATFTGNASTAAVFTAETLEATGGITAVSGLVADQNLRALPNVLVRIAGQQTRTGNDGRFNVASVAAGPHQVLELIGRDQITLPGRWPNISYDFDVLPGIDNDLGRPLFLPKVNDGVQMPLDSNSIVTQDTVFELHVVGGEPPIRVTAKAGTHIIFPPDVTDKRLSVTRIATNRTPMVLEDGRATNLYISVQPSGAIFETPLEVSFPNVDRLPAGREVLLMSFDHDAGRYVRVGTGHVSSDGRAVSSDAGSGIRIGAWHALPPSPPQPEVTVLGHIQIKDNSAFENKAILNVEAWVEGARAVLLSSPNAEDRLDFRATFSLPQGGSAKLAKMEATTVAVNVDAVMEAEGRNPDGSLASNEESSPKYPLLAQASSPFNVTLTSLSDTPLPLNVAAYLQSQGNSSGDLGIRYGGSEDSTSDSLLVRVRLLEGMQFLNPPKKVVWTVTGPGSDAYTPPAPSAASLSWDLGKLRPQAGILKIQAVVYWAAVEYGPPYLALGQLEVGIRSNDVAAIGWINPTGVPLSPNGIAPIILEYYPFEGMSNSSSAQRVLTSLHLLRIAAGDSTYPLPLYFDPISHFPVFVPMGASDKIYILNWMFKHGANPCNEGRCPPTSFAERSDLLAFMVARKTSYKQFNRFQIRYRVQNGELNGPPTVDEKDAEAGVTIDPIFGTEVPGVDGDDNESFSIANNAIARLVNDGNPDPVPVAAFNTLAYPFSWNNIGSRIELGPPFGTGSRVINQVYPTYYIFDNLVKTDTRPQAANPIGNFTRSPSKPHVP